MSQSSISAKPLFELPKDTIGPLIPFYQLVISNFPLSGGEDDHKNQEDSFLSGGTSVKISIFKVLTYKFVFQFFGHHQFENFWQPWWDIQV